MMDDARAERNRRIAALVADPRQERCDTSDSGSACRSAACRTSRNVSALPEDVCSTQSAAASQAANVRIPRGLSEYPYRREYRRLATRRRTQKAGSTQTTASTHSVDR